MLSWLLVGEGPTLPLPTEGDSIYLSRLTGCQAEIPLADTFSAQQGPEPGRPRQLVTAQPVGTEERQAW